MLSAHVQRNERAHGAYGRASEGELVLVDHDQCLALPHNGVALAWTCRLRTCSSHKQVLRPMRAGALTSRNRTHM